MQKGYGQSHLLQGKMTYSGNFFFFLTFSYCLVQIEFEGLRPIFNTNSLEQILNDSPVPFSAVLQKVTYT